MTKWCYVHSQLVVILQQLLLHGWHHMVVLVHILSCHRQLGIMNRARLNSVVILGNGRADGLTMLVNGYN